MHKWVSTYYMEICDQNEISIFRAFITFLRKQSIGTTRYIRKMVQANSLILILAVKKLNVKISVVFPSSWADFYKPVRLLTANLNGHQPVIVSKAVGHQWRVFQCPWTQNSTAIERASWHHQDNYVIMEFWMFPTL